MGSNMRGSVTRAVLSAQACRSRELALLVAHALPRVVAVLVSAASTALP